MLVILLSSYVCAFSLGCLYHRDHPLELSPGGTADILISLQTSGGSGDITVTGNIIKGSEILEFVNPSDTYTIPAGGEAKIYLKASMPSSAAVGEVYAAEISFTTVTQGAQGTFGFGSSILRKFDIVTAPLVTEELPEEKFGIATILIILIVVIIIIIIIILFLKRKKKKEKK